MQVRRGRDWRDLERQCRRGVARAYMAGRCVAGTGEALQARHGVVRTGADWSGKDRQARRVTE
jgi:hypothetical protein